MNFYSSPNNFISVKLIEVSSVLSHIERNKQFMLYFDTETSSEESTSKMYAILKLLLVNEVVGL
jgi:hypothetical protein